MQNFNLKLQVESFECKQVQPQFKGLSYTVFKTLPSEDMATICRLAHRSKASPQNDVSIDKERGDDVFAYLDVFIYNAKAHFRLWNVQCKKYLFFLCLHGCQCSNMSCIGGCMGDKVLYYAEAARRFIPQLANLKSKRRNSTGWLGWSSLHRPQTHWTSVGKVTQWHIAIYIYLYFLLHVFYKCMCVFSLWSYSD